MTDAFVEKAGREGGRRSQGASRRERVLPVRPKPASLVAAILICALVRPGLSGGPVAVTGAPPAQQSQASQAKEATSPRRIAAGSKSSALIAAGALVSAVGGVLVPYKEQGRYFSSCCRKSGLAIWAGGLALAVYGRAIKEPRDYGLGVSPALVSFDAVPRGGSQTRAVTIRNNKKKSGVEIRSVQVLGDSYSLPNPPQVPLILPARNELELAAVFRPVSAGSHPGKVEITFFLPDKSETIIVVVRLQGTVQP